MVTVNVAGAPLDPGVTLVGATLHVLSDGAPEQASVTAPVNAPPTPEIVSGYDAICPGETVCAGVVGVIIKSITASAMACVLGAGAPVEVADTVTLYCPPGVPVVVPRVIITDTGALTVGFTVAEGEKLQVTPVAGALQESVTAPAKVPSAVTCATTIELPPGSTLMLAGDGAPSVKSTTFKVTFCVLGAGAFTEVPETVRVYCPTGVAVVVVTVVVTFTGVLGVGLTLAEGAKAQVTPAAGALQERSTALVKAPVALTCIAKLEIAPGREVRDDGDGAPSRKSATFTVSATVCIVVFESLPVASRLKLKVAEVGFATVSVKGTPEVVGVNVVGEKLQVCGAVPMQLNVTELLYPATAVTVPLTVPD